MGTHCNRKKLSELKGRDKAINPLLAEASSKLLYLFLMKPGRISYNTTRDGKLITDCHQLLDAHVYIKCLKLSLFDTDTFIYNIIYTYYSSSRTQL